MLATPNIDQILYCASNLAYDVDASGNFSPGSNNIYLKNIGSYSRITPFSNQKGWGIDKINAAILIDKPQYNILAFRGTLSDFYDCATWQDWIQDIISTTRSVRGYPGKVHEGIYDAYSTLKTAIFKQLKVYGDKPLFITGHSKGGPMSTYATFDALKQKLAVKRVTTFASPRPGDVKFATGYNQLTHENGFLQTRYENDLDLIPLLPPEKSSIDFMVNTLRGIAYLIGDSTTIGKDLEWFAGLLSDSAKWNYSPVGTLLYITKDYHVVGESPGLWNNRLQQFELDFWNNAWDPLKAVHNIVDAHGLAIGGGYQKGVYPSIS